MSAALKRAATCCEALAQASAMLARQGVESPQLDARLLLQHALSCSHEDLVQAPERALTPEQFTAFEALVVRRAAREPLSHITGTREFWGLRFEVGADVLDPRPDSETLVESVLDACSQQAEKKRILDLGTGSGCLLLALLSEYKESQGLGVDISPAALQIARKNAHQLKLDDRAQFVQSHWCADVSGTFDIIVSNPPYIAPQEFDTLEPEVRQYEPKLALVADDEGLACYRQILSQVGTYMNDNALLVLEIGVTQA